MMLVKDISNDPEYQQYEIRRPRNFARNADADVERMIIDVDPDFNLGFRSRRAMLNGNRRFSCVIPLSHIFGFCRDVRKVIFGAKHTVVLVRKGTDDDAIWRLPGIDAGIVILTKLSLWMPVMTPSISE